MARGKRCRSGRKQAAVVMGTRQQQRQLTSSITTTTTDINERSKFDNLQALNKRLLEEIWKNKEELVEMKGAMASQLYLSLSKISMLKEKLDGKKTERSSLDEIVAMEGDVTNHEDGKGKIRPFEAVSEENSLGEDEKKKQEGEEIEQKTKRVISFGEFVRIDKGDNVDGVVDLDNDKDTIICKEGLQGLGDDEVVEEEECDTRIELLATMDKDIEDETVQSDDSMSMMVDDLGDGEEDRNDDDDKDVIIDQNNSRMLYTNVKKLEVKQNNFWKNMFGVSGAIIVIGVISFAYAGMKKR